MRFIAGMRSLVLLQISGLRKAFCASRFIARVGLIARMSASVVYQIVVAGKAFFAVRVSALKTLWCWHRRHLEEALGRRTRLRLNASGGQCAHNGVVLRLQAGR